MTKRLVFIALIFILSVSVHGQEDKEHLFQTDTVQMHKNVQIIGLPLVFYTPETSFGGGGGAQLFFHNQRNLFNNRVSNLFAAAIYTANKQLSINLIPQFYFFNGTMYLEGDFVYKIYPNSFWGIGGDTPEDALETYNMETFSIRASLVNRIPPYLNFGFEYLFENHVMLEVKEGGMMDSGEVLGSDGARISGLSFVLDFDSRDNIYSTLGGAFLTFKGGFSAKSFGASYAYNKYLIDLRKYFILAGKHTLAVQAYLESATGTVPFQSMAWLGGPERNRGYFNGRYMNNAYLLVQAEMRWRIWSRLHINAFAALGQVSGEVDDLFNSGKFSGGAGLRFQALKSNPTLLRFDFGINQYGGTGIYFGVNEVF
jgi:hypothetical protein